MKPKTVLYVDYYSFVGGGQVNLLSVFKALDGRRWKLSSRYNDIVLAVSQQGLSGLKALGIPEAKLRLLYNNADLEHFGRAKALGLAALKRFGVPAKQPLILAAGMRRPHKGFDI